MHSCTSFPYVQPCMDIAYRQGYTFVVRTTIAFLDGALEFIDRPEKF